MLQFQSFSDFILTVGGHGSGGTVDTVEVVSPDADSNPVPECIKTLGNFPTTIDDGVATTFGKFNG